MTDAHFHRNGTVFASLGAEEFRFCGVHPWDAENADPAAWTERLRSMLAADPSLGIGEIGLDRLKSRTVSPRQREMFAAQLAIAAEAGRPVVLHGAKCWGEVVRMLKPFAGRIPAFLFHGFSRSDGLLPDIVAAHGFVGVGKAVLNDHAVNYREMAKRIPPDRLLVESDCTAENAAEWPLVEAVAAKLAEVRGEPPDALFAPLEENADRCRGL